MFADASTSTPDIKVAIVIPSGVMDIVFNSSAALADTDVMEVSGTSTAGISLTTSKRRLSFDGTVVLGDTSGAIKFQWAQNTASAVNTTVYTGSFMELRET